MRLARRAQRREADLAFYAYRDLNITEAEPFLLAAMERSPVAPACTTGWKDDKIIATIVEMPNESIYDGNARLAQPDEVWNFGRGDGLEKAILLANILHSRRPAEAISIEITRDETLLVIGRQTYPFRTEKKVKPQRWDLSGYHSGN